jgi:hypothetical protein
MGFWYGCYCMVAAGVWVFLTSDPSPVAWVLAILFVSYSILGYCLLEIHLMELQMGGAPVNVRAHQPSPLQLDDPIKTPIGTA